MSLRKIFDELYAQAALQGEASRQLAQGAGVRVRVAGQRRQVVLSRQGAPVGTVEVITFQAHGGIPDDAVGVSYLPTATGLYRVAFTWETQATLFDLPASEPICTTSHQLAPVEANRTIYTLGYAGWSPALVAAEVSRLSATLWDIRYQPWSKSPQWRREALAALLGPAYVYVRALGNINYRGGPIQLADPAAAVERARAALAQRPLVLLCGCKDHRTCHRSVAAAYLAEALGGVAVEHLVVPRPEPGPAYVPGHVVQLLAEGEPLPGNL